MMYYEDLMGKNAIATIKVSKELLKYSVGERIPTVSEFVDSLKSGPRHGSKRDQDAGGS